MPSKSATAIRRQAPLATPAGFETEAVRDISAALNAVVADGFALYVKTKNFHWHMSGPHFRDYHLLLDEQATQIFPVLDGAAERVRKIGGITVHSIGQIAKLKHIADNDADFVDPPDMLAELREDNNAFAERLLSAHATCEDHDDVATASLLEIWIDEAQRRAWFLFEAARGVRD